MLLLAPAPAPKPKSSPPLPPPRWENYTRRSFRCGALFFVFSRKNSENSPRFFRKLEEISGAFPLFCL